MAAGSASDSESGHGGDAVQPRSHANSGAPGGAQLRLRRCAPAWIAPAAGGLSRARVGTGGAGGVRRGAAQGQLPGTDGAGGGAELRHRSRRPGQTRRHSGAVPRPLLGRLPDLARGPRHRRPGGAVLPGGEGRKARVDAGVRGGHSLPHGRGPRESSPANWRGKSHGWRQSTTTGRAPAAAGSGSSAGCIRRPRATRRWKRIRYASSEGNMSGKTRQHELEIEMNATAERVWQALSTAEGIASWFAPVTRVEPGVGGSVFLTMGRRHGRLPAHRGLGTGTASASGERPRRRGPAERGRLLPGRQGRLHRPAAGAFRLRTRKRVSTTSTKPPAPPGRCSSR